MKGPFLITGASGFVGGCVAVNLKRHGIPFVAVGKRGSSPQPGVAWQTIDLANDGLPADFPTIGTVLHCAAQIPRTYDDTEAADANRRIDDNILKFARDRRLDLVFVSTAAIQGAGKAPPDGPALITSDTGPYALEKARSEDTGMTQAVKAGTLFAAVRITSPYGPFQKSKGVMNLFIEKAIAGNPITFHGSGNREQDFIYGDDVAAALLAATKGPSGYYNVAGAEPVTMRNLGLIIARAAGLAATIVQPSGQPDPQEGFRARYDITKAEQALGWRPLTGLSEGIDKCIVAMRHFPP